MSAIISECEKYRYSLGRETSLATGGYYKPVVFVMLNPSTADASEDDPTIRRCMGFAESWAMSHLIVVNLYALRATNPSELWSANDPFGPDNLMHLGSALDQYKKVVCAWGANARPKDAEQFRNLADHHGADLYCLGVTKAGAPRHPLYLKRDTQTQKWPTPPAPRIQQKP